MALSLIAPAMGLLLGSEMTRSLLSPLRREATGWLLVFSDPPAARHEDLEGALYRTRRSIFLPQLQHEDASE